MVTKQITLIAARKRRGTPRAAIRKAVAEVYGNTDDRPIRSGRAVKSKRNKSSASDFASSK